MAARYPEFIPTARPRFHVWENETLHVRFYPFARSRVVLFPFLFEKRGCVEDERGCHGDGDRFRTPHARGTPIVNPFLVLLSILTALSTVVAGAVV